MRRTARRFLLSKGTGEETRQDREGIAPARIGRRGAEEPAVDRGCLIVRSSQATTRFTDS